MDLKGKVALVTGASAGIGTATALALAGRGMKVAIMARRRERLDALAEDITQAGGEALVCPADMRNEEQILKAFQDIDERWQRLDVVVNNAGLGRLASMHEGETEHWREMLDVNVLALTIATREALKRFPKEGGHLINIASMASHRVPPGGGFYSATKYAVKVITEITRRELRERGSLSRVSQISPGFVDTEFFEVLTGDKDKGQEIISKIEDPLTPKDIAASILHVLDAPAHVSIHDVWIRPTHQQT